MGNEDQIDFNKKLSQIKKARTIKECFHHKKEECNGDIKQSHSIQRNGRLSIIEDEIEGNKMLFTFTNFQIGTDKFIKNLRPIGKGVASTFFGFCDYHDTVLFSEIENKGFNNCDKHCFLHSYRSFAHSYHTKKEEKKGREKDDPLNSNYPDRFKDGWITGNNYAINDLNIYKQDLDFWIENKVYDQLEYFTVILPDLYPVACSSLISPFYSIKGVSMNNHTNPNIPWSPIMLTVLPDFTQTIVIFACFPNDEKGIDFLNELNELGDYQFKKTLTSILIFFAENTFFSPLVWKKLGKRNQRILCDEIEKGILMGLVENPKKFEYSNLNFFENRYTFERLKAK